MGFGLGYACLDQLLNVSWEGIAMAQYGIQVYEHLGYLPFAPLMNQEFTVANSMASYIKQFCLEAGAKRKLYV